MYDKLVEKVNNIDISGFVLKTKYNTDKSDLKKKIADVNNLVKKTDYNSKITKIEAKIPRISALATNYALTAVGNKIPDVSNLVKKTDYDTKMSDIASKYITTVIYDKFTKGIVDNSIESKSFADKSAISGFINNAELDKKVATLARKAELKVEQDKISQLYTFDFKLFSR